MFETLKAQPADKILSLMAAFREDPREGKIDLGVGVYKNAEGQTPIMRSVKTAEQKLWQIEDTKSYTGLAGDAGFHDALRMLILGDAATKDQVAAAATPGGTGAIRQGLELIRMASPKATVWLSAPTWPNHPSIIKYLGMPMAEYRYFDAETRGVDFGGMLTDLDQAKPGDVVLLHGCCHNPTGANLTASQWQEVADFLKSKQLIPFVDIAYQGFGDGLDADAFGPRHLAKTQPEMLIAASCSKNFGVYRERVGLLMAVSQDPSKTPLNQGTVAFLNRQNYSFPPDHGARLVTMVLTDDALRSDWLNELEGIRTGMLSLRQSLADALRKRTNSDRFDFIAQHRGMFSRLGATEAQVEQMRQSHGIYMVSDSRLNIAGLNAQSVPILADAIVAAGV
ncbi:aromatic amino acid transaminase [Litoreibacter janthinus]|uniref:Aminotransferase n=1 Tax=Litoreibacter janthinus TaxID=670154 RepID=A0A1I6FUE2_9RHOB|nr:amino acid aminotransferase [Litoreibacter janthinus]SFR33506.1 aromatic amino acid aminotransferase apoenzyme [Litoreibacter janthinus]